jgi:hypothetical protein
MLDLGESHGDKAEPDVVGGARLSRSSAIGTLPHMARVCSAGGVFRRGVRDQWVVLPALEAGICGRAVEMCCGDAHGING